MDIQATGVCISPFLPVRTKSRSLTASLNLLLISPFFSFRFLSRHRLNGVVPLAFLLRNANSSLVHSSSAAVAAPQRAAAPLCQNNTDMMYSDISNFNVRHSRSRPTAVSPLKPGPIPFLALFRSPTFRLAMITAPALLVAWPLLSTLAPIPYALNSPS